MDGFGFHFGSALPAASLWFVIVYYAFKGTFKKSLGWPVIWGALFVAVLSCAIASSLLAGPDQGANAANSAIIDSVLIPIVAASAILGLVFTKRDG